jgi:hypothetical protein
MTLQLLPSEFPLYEEFLFLLYMNALRSVEKMVASLRFAATKEMGILGHAYFEYKDFFI